jgi:hypothetical protein
MTSSTCPVCTSQLLLEVSEPQTGALAYGCPRCGGYQATFEAVNALRELSNKHWACRYETSHAIRRRHDPDGPRFLVTASWLASVWANAKLPTPQESADIFVDYLGSANRVPTDWVRCRPAKLKGLLGTADEPTRQDGIMYVVDHLRAKGLIEHPAQIQLPADDGVLLYRLTFDGWERFDDLRRRAVDSHIAFMAMDFKSEATARAFAAFIAAVDQTGFELRRLDQKPKAGLIDLRMRVEIRAAKFLVADLTDENRGAYWEAGFAEGLGKKVYYTCEASKFDKVKTHFDTEHLLTVKWAADNMAPALDELKSAIRNYLPADAVQFDDPAPAA